MKIITNANEKLEALIYNKGMQSVYKATIDNVSNAYVIDFTLHLHILITKIAIAINDILIEPKYTGLNYYKQLVPFLCKTILNNQDLYKEISSLKLNEAANDQKHNLDLNNINMQQCISVYNKLLRQLSQKINTPALLKLIINVTPGQTILKHEKKQIAQSKNRQKT